MKTLILYGLIAFTSLSGYAQDKIEPRVDVIYTYVNGEKPKVGARIRKRLNRRFFPVPGAKVKLFFNEDLPENEIGSITTNERGEGELEFPASILSQWLGSEQFDLLAFVEPSDSLEEASETVSIAKAKLEVDGADSDDGRVVTATVLRFQDDDWIPAEEVELKLFIKRQFGRLPLGDDYYETDEDGTAQATFEIEIPGNEAGEIVISAFVEDHEEFGNLFASTKQTWGMPTIDDNTAFNKRTLWASRDKTPLWLLIFPNLMILGVWGTIGYVILQIVRIRKIANQ